MGEVNNGVTHEIISWVAGFKYLVRLKLQESDGVMYYSVYSTAASCEDRCKRVTVSITDDSYIEVGGA